MLYVISYDLRQPTRNYQRLYEHLHKLGAKRVLERVWIARRENTSVQSLCDSIKARMDDNDGLLVTYLGDGEWGTWNARVDINTV